MVIGPTLLWILAVALVVVGIAGTVLPAIPGAPLVFAGLLVAAWADGFRKVGPLPLVLIGLLTLVAFAVDWVAALLGAKKVGASRWALLGAAVGTVAGLFFGLPGLLLGPFAGAAAGELFVARDLRQAGKVGLGTWLGFLFGTLAKLAVVFSMLGVFAVSWVL